MMDHPIASPETWSGPPGPAEVVRPRRYLPVATYTLLAMNVAMFCLTTVAGGSQNPDVLLNFGASYAPMLRQGQYWRLVMPMFLHVGLLHLLVNMYALFLLGPLLERIYGYGRFAFIYVAAGISGSYLSMARSYNIAAGASGAIFGVSGAILVAGYLHRDALPYPLARAFRLGRLSLTLVIFIIANLILGFSIRGIDNFGHLGGLVGGMLLAFLISPPSPASARGYTPGAADEKPSQAILMIPVLVIALAMGATAIHYRTFREVSRLLQEGKRLRASRQYDQAMDRFRAAERLVPGDERPHEDLGVLYLEQRRYDEAAREFNQALQVNPAAQEAQLGLAVIYQQKGDLGKAQKLFEAVLGKNPHNAEAQEELADLCMGQKLYQDAIEHYQEALRLSPNLAVAHNNLAWLYATCDDAKFRNPGSALEHARRAVELTHWKEPDFIDTLAEAFYANGNYAEAVKVQTKALQLAPNNREFQEHMVRYQKAAGA